MSRTLDSRIDFSDIGNYCRRCYSKANGLKCKRCPSYNPDKFMIGDVNADCVDLTTQKNVFITSSHRLIVYLPSRSRRMITIRVLDGTHRLITHRTSKSREREVDIEMHAGNKYECIYVEGKWFIMEYESHMHA